MSAELSAAEKGEENERNLELEEHAGIAQGIGLS